MKVSILILTYNEAANLPACLDAVRWCDDILIVDSGSTDGTTEIAHAYGARILTRSFDNFANQRNFGLEEGAVRHEWVLHLDADEVITESFARQLDALVPEKDVQAWRVASKTILLGRWLRHAGMWPAYQVRLGHARHLRFIQVGHGQRETFPPERVGTLSESLLHYPFSRGFKHWLEKHVRYAQDEATLIESRRKEQGALTNLFFSRSSTARRRAAKALACRLPPFTRPVMRFFYVYFIRGGFLDGKPGLIYASMLAVYEAMTAILVYELKQGDTSNDIPDAGKGSVRSVIPGNVS